MKLLITTLLLTTSWQVQAHTCYELQSETARSFRDWKETVDQCLNDYETGLAGQFEKSLRIFAEACVESCDGEYSEAEAYCDKIPSMIQRYKRIYPLRCTN